MKNKLTLGSLFAGSGGFELAGILCGIEPRWSSEIEPYPIRVTTKRMPFVKHYGDVSILNGAELEPVDIITFGSPCQDLSIAGKRAGLSGERSGLYMQAVRIIKEMLEASDREYPKFCVFENVPGLLSSNKGEDFKTCLDMMQEAGFIPDINILDAQDMGVAQRRKRVYITWINADHILRKRTNISDSITLQLLSEILLLNLEELQRAYKGDRKKSNVREKSRYEDSLKKRIRLFSLQKEDRLQQLQKNLEEIQVICSKERTNSDSTHGEDRIMNPCISEVIKSDAIIMENGYMSIGQLLRNSLEESSLLMNASITSTWSKQTIDRKIFFYLHALQTTLDVTIHLMGSLRRTPMSLNCFEWVRYVLTEMKGCIDAEIKSNKVAGDMERDELLRLYKSKLSETEHDFERSFTEQCGSEVLPEFKSLFLDFEPCCCKSQRAA